MHYQSYNLRMQLNIMTNYICLVHYDQWSPASYLKKVSHYHNNSNRVFLSIGRILYFLFVH